MAVKGVALTIVYTAYDTANNIGKTGDGANHTLRWIKDGLSAAPVNAGTQVEIDSTNAKGEYKIVITATEMQCDFGELCGVSSTANIIIIPVKITTEHGVLALLQAGVNLPAAGLDSIVIETGLNARQALSIIAAATAGQSSGQQASGASSPVFLGAGVATTRITGTVDASGNRTAVTLSPPA